MKDLEKTEPTAPLEKHGRTRSQNNVDKKAQLTQGLRDSAAT